MCLKDFVKPSIFIIIFAFATSCEREVIYELEPETIYQNAAEKENLKTPSQFISIAYNDLFAATLPASTLNDVSLAFQAFGDNKLIEKLLIENFLNSPDADVPLDSEMRDDLEQFVERSYLKFYNRLSNEFEVWKWEQMLLNDEDISALMVYSAFLTSEEYRYY
jgi:hypothetical protein